MSSGTTTHFCAPCGRGSQANHFFLWLESTTDALTLWTPSRSFPTFYRLFARLGDRALDLLGRVLFAIGTTLGLVTLSDDVEKTVSNRSKLLWEEALRRGLDMRQILFLGSPTDSFRVRHGGRPHFFRSLPLAPATAALRMDDKIAFKSAMREAGLPVPRSESARNVRTASRILERFGNVCVKPRTGSNGRHTYPFVSTEEDLSDAFRSVKQISFSASIEEHLEGDLCRATCVDGVLLGFLKSEYPKVTGDGTSTVEELIAKSNATKASGVGDIIVDDSYRGYMRRRGYDLADVLPEGETLQLTYRAGAGAGGNAYECGRSIHHSFIDPIEAAASATGLKVVGFDIIIPDALAPASEQRWGFIEANSLPWIDLHATPYSGEPTDLSVHVWDLWLKENVADTR